MLRPQRARQGNAERAAFAVRDVLGPVQHGGVGLADNLLCAVTVEPAGAFVPRQDRSVEVFANDGILGRGFEEVVKEG